ncbi:conserved hypothetical protein [Talaromyces stipitatus ATCC 10500]|uniref:AB hydrolase-1 domain-containing protein n=1 Tax=Talaromyces stipitatus (strain ATCC 10500 / CBS 375.48 / QM 6759 / NRRL 1006) TaxID=441959 RepID=B8MJ98_TALSN|nr:uncharacterized protein TSTA_041650 [Talaromyces stipitatus ATCC 10500]EED14687.1 conserved hypothetical protein [Talaromyces stipitatus ATCC 10500]
MASSNKPTVLFVHGAFHGPDCFDALISPLKAADYFGSIKNNLKLPSAELNSSSSLQQDIDVLRAEVLKVLDGPTVTNGPRGGSDCVVVMHSYGAVPAAEALRGLGRSERGVGNTAVVKMVYLSCNIPKAGDSHVGQLTAWIAERGLSADLPLEPLDNGILKFTGAADVFYNGLPEDQQASLIASLSTQSAAVLTTPLKGSVGSMAYDEIPGWYLLCKNDNILPEAFQRECIRVVRDGMERVEEVDAGHSSFMVVPEIVADFILRAAKSGNSQRGTQHHII